MDNSGCEGLAFRIGIAQHARNTKITVNNTHCDIDAGLYFARVNVTGLFEFLNACLEVFLFLHSHDAFSEQ